MKTQLLNDAEPKVYALVFDKDDAVMAELEAFAGREGIHAASFTGIGAFARATLGFFERETKDYAKIEIAEAVEVLSLVGNIGRDEHDKPKLHVHVVVGKRDGSAMGGHLLDAKVWPTLELVVREEPAYLRRRTDTETGLPLIVASSAR